MFSWFTYEFMRNAFTAVLLITPLFAMLGTMIVNNKMSFFSDALGHSALAGIAIGSLLGIGNPILSMILFALIFGYGLNKVKSTREFSNDTIISVFSSITVAVGLVLLSRNGNFNKYSSYLIGDILSIEKSEIYLLAVVLVVAIIFWLFYFNRLLAVATNSSLAKSKGINVELVEDIFVMFIAIIVMISIKWVGILLINSLLILPAASSKNIAQNMRQYHFWALVFSVFSGIGGLILSYYIKTATGPTIVLFSGVIFFITFSYRLIKGRE